MPSDVRPFFLTMSSSRAEFLRSMEAMLRPPVFRRLHEAMLKKAREWLFSRASHRYIPPSAPTRLPSRFNPVSTRFALSISASERAPTCVI